jgi:flagellar assembly factor FliW
MEKSKEITTNTLEIDTRLGPRCIDTDRIVHFPRGLAGFENEHDFVLLQIRANAPMLILQSIHHANVGLLVADPYSFLQDYTIVINDAEEKLLHLQNIEEAAILVTVSIPAGEPENAVLHLTGPIVINHKARLGMQIPQSTEGPGLVNMHSLKPIDNTVNARDKQTEAADCGVLRLK